MVHRSQQGPYWPPSVRGTFLTIVFAIVLVWVGWRIGRTVWFAFFVNWVLIAWAIWLSRILESRSGAWDGIDSRFPASYYAIRPFEKSGRLYNYAGVRWYQRLLRPILWSLKPAQLRSKGNARQTMARATKGPEAGHLVIFVVISGIALFTLVRGWWNTAAWLMLFNVLHNAYPVLSLRQIRARLNQPQRRAQDNPALLDRA